MADQSLQAQSNKVVFYSDTFITAKASASVDPLEGIKLKLASINIGTARTDSLQEHKIHHYQRWTDSSINAFLSAVYTIPLVRITRTGRNYNAAGNEVAFFPDPIPEIATAMVAAQIVFHEYTDIDPNTNEAANALMLAAEDKLREIVGIDGQVGSLRLEGQQLKARHPFAPPGVMPLNTLKPR
jgi:hypothetical protein